MKHVPESVKKTEEKNIIVQADQRDDQTVIPTDDRDDPSDEIEHDGGKIDVTAIESHALVDGATIESKKCVPEVREERYVDITPIESQKRSEIDSSRSDSKVQLKLPNDDAVTHREDHVEVSSGTAVKDTETSQRDLIKDFDSTAGQKHPEGFICPRTHPVSQDWSNTSIGVEDIVDNFLRLHGGASGGNLVTPAKRHIESLQLPVRIGNVGHESYGNRDRLTSQTVTQQPGEERKKMPAEQLPPLLLQRLHGIHQGSLNSTAGAVPRLNIFVSERFLELFPFTIGALRKEHSIACIDCALQEPVDVIINPTSAITLVRISHDLDLKALKRKLIRTLTQIAFKFTTVIAILLYDGGTSTSTV